MGSLAVSFDKRTVPQGPMISALCKQFLGFLVQSSQTASPGAGWVALPRLRFQKNAGSQ
jgi:hypothetical protein